MDNLEEIPSVYVNDSNGSNSDHTHPEPAARRTLQPAKRASIPKVGWSDIAETSSIIPPDPDSNVSASSAPDPTFSSELDMLPSVDSSSDIQQIANGGYARYGKFGRMIKTRVIFYFLNSSRKYFLS